MATTKAKKTAKKPAKPAAKKTDGNKEELYTVGSIHSIPLEKIEKTENLLRLGEFSTNYYLALAKSMFENGYQPIDVYRKEGRFYISDGFTRFEAARRDKQKEIKCIIIEEEKALSNALHKAMMRNDLTALERAEAFQRYMDESEPKKTAADLAAEFRKSPTNISQILSVLRLPEGMRKFIKGKPFTLRDLLELVKIEDNPDEQWALCNDIDNKRKAEKEEATQFGIDHHSDEAVEDDSEERRSEDEVSPKDANESNSEKGKGEGRKTRFQAIESKIEDIHEKIKSLLTVEEQTASKRGPKKLPLTVEEKAELKKKLSEILETLETSEIPSEAESTTEANTETTEATPEAVEPEKTES